MPDHSARDDSTRRSDRGAAILTALLLLWCILPAHAATDAAGSRQATYPHMAPAAQYQIATAESEIALARSAAPAAISDSATVLTLTREGYQTAVQGSNGFTCLVERSWTSPFDSAEFWNPKLRGPVCYNPAASRSVLKYTLYRTKLALSGVSKERMLEDIRGACDRGELPPPEPGAMSYMLSKDGYLGDDAGHWHPHLMFHVPKTDAASWGANLPGSPVVFDRQHHETPEPQTIFFVPVGKWSDGTAEHAG
jgi:hypothetical protein